jgi:hypothetical protein
MTMKNVTTKPLVVYIDSLEPHIHLNIVKSFKLVEQYIHSN